MTTRLGMVYVAHILQLGTRFIRILASLTHNAAWPFWGYLSFEHDNTNVACKRSQTRVWVKGMVDGEDVCVRDMLACYVDSFAFGRMEGIEFRCGDGVICAKLVFRAVGTATSWRVACPLAASMDTFKLMAKCDDAREGTSSFPATSAFWH